MKRKKVTKKTVWTNFSKVTKKTVWTNFSKFIRLKECLETTGTLNFGKCCTCNSVLSFNKLQAGHFVPGRSNAVLFHEDIVHLQCISCNHHKSGNLTEYVEYMHRRYGIEKTSYLRGLRYQKVKYSEFDFYLLNEEFKKKIKLLENGDYVKKNGYIKFKEQL